MNVSKCVCNLFKNGRVTGAPGVAPVAGNPGLTIGIMGAPTPGAPGLHRDRQEEKRDNKTQCWPSDRCEGHLRGEEGRVIVHQCPVMLRLV